MKKISLFIAWTIMLSSVMVATSCKKEGPAGPEGPQGPQGEKGDPAATVTYSDWLNVNFTPDSASNGSGGYDTVGWTGIINAPKLTSEILNQGAIKVYLNLNTMDAPIIVSLPFFDDIYPFYIPNTIVLAASENYSSIDFGSGNIIQQYRYILIPGGDPARSSVNWDDYEEVKKYLKLKD